MTATVPVYDVPRAVKTFVAHGLWQGRRTFDDAATAIGFANPQDGLVAGFVYHNWEPEAGVIELSAYASERGWACKAWLRVIFDYPFDQLGARLVAGRHSARNRRVIRIWRALGAKQYRIPELWAPGEAEVIALLARETWLNSRFIPKGDQHG